MTEQKSTTINEEFSKVTFLVRSVKRRFDPPVELPPDSGWTWYYECFAQVFNLNEINDSKPHEFFGYRVDGKDYAGVYVPAGFKYRVYNIGGGCVDYGIETIEQAIEQADKCLDNDLAQLQLKRYECKSDRPIDRTGQTILHQEGGYSPVMREPIEIPDEGE